MTAFFIVLLIILAMIGHEVAHVAVARLFRMHVHDFTIGLPFGPCWKIGAKAFVRPIVIGCSASIARFDQRALMVKLIVLASGVIFYFSAAWLSYFVGQAAYGEPHFIVVVNALSQSNSIARDAGVQVGDRLLQLDNTPIHRVEDVTSYIAAHPNQKIRLRVERNAPGFAPQEAEIQMIASPAGKVGMALVVSPENYHRVGLLRAASNATSGILAVLTATCELPLRLMSGKNLAEVVLSPIALFALSVTVLRDTPQHFPSLFGNIMACCAIIHLFPLPGLDGGHIVAMLISHFRKHASAAHGRLRYAFIAGAFAVFVSWAMPLCLVHSDDSDSSDS